MKTNFPEFLVSEKNERYMRNGKNVLYKMVNKNDTYLLRKILYADKLRYSTIFLLILYSVMIDRIW